MAALRSVVIDDLAATEPWTVMAWTPKFGTLVELLRNSAAQQN